MLHRVGQRVHDCVSLLFGDGQVVHADFITCFSLQSVTRCSRKQHHERARVRPARWAEELGQFVSAEMKQGTELHTELEGWNW